MFLLDVIRTFIPKVYFHFIAILFILFSSLFLHVNNRHYFNFLVLF